MTGLVLSSLVLFLRFRKLRKLRRRHKVFSSSSGISFFRFALSSGKDFATRIADLKKQIGLIHSENDLARADQCYREVRIELSSKRNQVTNLRKELDASNQKNFELTRALDVTKASLKEVEFNLKLALKKAAAIESKMKEVTESYTQVKLKEEMKAFEISLQNETIQKLTQEKQRLTRELGDLKEQMKFTSSFQEELQDRQSKINIALTRTAENVKKLEDAHSVVAELSRSFQDCQQIVDTNKYLANQNENLKQQIRNLEDCLTETKSKYETLASLLSARKYVNSATEDVWSTIQFLRWERRCRHLEDRNRTHEATIAALTEALDKEIETNAKLIVQIEVKEESGELIERE